MKPSELTIRGLILGSVIAIIFTAANVYLGLRVGITIASSIPAAVISMGIFRLFNTGSIRENNIVQTVASAGGTLSAIIFVLPGLVMIGWWQGFPFLTTFLICALGGTLGVLFSIPLRRALVKNSPLPFPEGVAAAEVLKVGATGDEAPQNVLERDKGPLIVLWGALIAAGAQIVGFMGFAATAMTQLFRVGQGVSGLTLGLSLALAGAGHLVGISVGIAMLCGLLISWAGLMPILTAGHEGSIAEIAEDVFRNQVRFVGAGAIGIAAIWSLVKLVGPLIKGVADTMAAGSAAKTDAHDDRDIPLGMIALLSIICLVAIAALLYIFIQGTPLTELGWPLIAGGVVFTVVVGAFIATVAGYMAGLIGASNSPVSGIGILAIVSGALLLALLAQPALHVSATDSLVAFALFTVAIVFSIATISNDNLQDLKTGQLVGASPWRQQIALIVGVIAGSLVIGPVLDLLNAAYGFPGDPNRAAIVAEPLAAPQATLISSLARGVLNADLDWNLILMGVGIGVVVIFVDEILGFLKLLRIPPLAVGIGMYLPQDVTTPVVIGAIIGYMYDRTVEKRENGEMAKRFGILLACGFIVGESLLGILNAGLIVATNNPAPIAVAGTENITALAPYIGLAMFALLLLVSYLWVSRQSRAK
jgi:putative OPT family oligopeptide transporter